MRKEHNHTRHIACLLALRLVMLLSFMQATAAFAQTKDKNVRVVCDWDFAPYAFINGERKPDGFNVELLQTVLNRLGIKPTFITKSRKQGIEAFTSYQADLIVDYSNRFSQDKYYSTVNSIEYYNLSVAFFKGTKPIKTRAELKQAKLIVLNGSNDSISKRILMTAEDTINVEYHSPREALVGIMNGDFQYFVCGDAPLKWQLKSSGLKGIEIQELDIPAKDIHIVGHDKELINAIDSEISRLQQSGDLEALRIKWFHQERMQPEASYTLLYILLVVTLIALAIFAIFRIAKRRVKTAMKHNKAMEAMMHQALSMGNYAVFINEIRKGHVSNLHGNVLPEGGITSKKLVEHIHPDDRHIILDRRKVFSPEELSKPFFIRWNEGTEKKPKWVKVEGHSFAELDKNHKPTSIIITTRDVTVETENEQHEQELANRYAKLFDTNLVAMSFYDKDGKLLDLNENMKILCEVNEENIEYFFSVSLMDMSLVKGLIVPGSFDVIHACQRMYYPEIGIDKFIEFRVRPTPDDKGNLLYYVVTARDVTVERSMYLELQMQRKAIKAASELNRTYETELRSLLENCNMWVWHADNQTRAISFSRSIIEKEFTITFDEYIECLAPEHQEEARRNIENYTLGNESFNVIHLFDRTPVSHEPTWYAISGMPLSDKDGHTAKLFGIVRNVTSLMEAQQKLKIETARAENSAILKSTFLANMTHEIRTPLNAIVGFSDLLHAVSTTEDRMEFINIIRNNCDMLLRLVNDIFEASTMDSKPIEIKPREVDFAKEFSLACLTLSQRVQEKDVEYIVDKPYDSLITTLDMGRMQQVITNFVTNAVKYTHKGHIRVGYKYKDNGIYMYCEDTGTGIPKEKQSTVFERFVKLNDYVQGTGLGLSICKSIADAIGGRIGVESEGEGKGSTFWLWVPCEIKKEEEE